MKRYLRKATALCALAVLPGCTTQDLIREMYVQICQHASDQDDCKSRVRSGRMYERSYAPEINSIQTDDELYRRAEESR